MPFKSVEEGKTYRKKHRRDNLARYHERARAYTLAGRRRAREVIDSYKKSHPCVDCGYSDYRALDFDHRDRQAKRYNVSAMTQSTYRIATVLAEIAKCDMRCANCHRIKTWTENGGHC